MQRTKKNTDKSVHLRLSKTGFTSNLLQIMKTERRKGHCDRRLRSSIFLCKTLGLTELVFVLWYEKVKERSAEHEKIQIERRNIRQA